MTPPPGHDSFEVDRDAIKAVGQLRLFAAVGCALSGIWIVSVNPGRLGWTIAVLGWLAALGWVMAFVRSNREARREDIDPLVLDAAGLRWTDGKERHKLTWSEVQKIEIDEDHLEIQVTTVTGVQYRIQSIYRGVGVHDLAEVLKRHHLRPSQTAESH